MSLQHPAGTSDRPTTVENRTSLGEGSDHTYGVESNWLATIESMIERYPWPTLLLALGLGYLLSTRMR
jgi:hypothetical protein